MVRHPEDPKRDPNVENYLYSVPSGLCGAMYGAVAGCLWKI